MNTEYVRELAGILAAHGLTSLEINEGETRIRIEKRTSGRTPQARAQPAALAAEEFDSDAGNGANSQMLDFNHLIEIKSPLVGVFYSSPSPDSEAFVSIGSKVKKGDVLCIIEAMKLMNEITAEQDGEIVDICAKNGDIAEFGQVLFKMY